MGFALLAVLNSEQNDNSSAHKLKSDLENHRKCLEKHRDAFCYNLPQESFEELNEILYQDVQKIFDTIGEYPRRRSRYKKLMKNKNIKECWQKLREEEDEHSLPKLIDVTGENDYSQKDYIRRIISSVIQDFQDFEYELEKFIESEDNLRSKQTK